VTETIAIVNEKGGTGKTTTAVNLSAALGELGRKVLLVDLDGQAASSRWLGVEDDTRFADALWSGEAFEPIAEVVPGVSLAPGSGKLDSVAHDLRPTQGGQLRKVLGLLGAFDHIIIDCPPSLGNRLIGNALLAATHAIVPVEASILALDGLKILLTTFQDVRDGFGHDIALRGVLACRYDHRTRLSRLVLAELNRSLPGRVFQTVIRENIRMRECPGSGKSILAYAPDSHAAEDYRLLAKEFLATAADATVPRADGTLSETELSDEERQAILDIRGQVKAMLQATETRSPRSASYPARPAALGAAPQSQPDMLDEDEIDALAGSVKIEGPAPFTPLPLPEVPPEEPARVETQAISEAISESPAPEAITPAAEDQAPVSLEAVEQPAVNAVAPDADSPAEQPAVSEVQPVVEAAQEPQASLPDTASEIEPPVASTVEPPAADAVEPAPVSEVQPDADHAAEPLAANVAESPVENQADSPVTNDAEPAAVSEVESPALSDAEPPSTGPDFGRQEPAGSGERRQNDEAQPDRRSPANSGELTPFSPEPLPVTEAAQAPEPPAPNDSMAALRAVLETIKKQAEPADEQPEAKKSPVWRRFFNKRSA
jgi:chromosome partitioning protein